MRTMHVFTQHIQWNAVQQVIDQLRAKGYKALLAGGCVRDLLMLRTPNDFDIATDANPDEVAAIFPKALTVGREFGVTILPFKTNDESAATSFHVEVATFRTDGPYLDGRRPSHIEFSSPEEDARRRDFTVNALFYDTALQTVIDFVGGQEDLRAGIIRAVGDPEKRFTEDKLRLLRAIRFAAQLDFTIEPRTMNAIRLLHQQVGVVAAERIRDELVKLLMCRGAARGLQLLFDTGLLAVVLVEIAASLSRGEVLQATKARLQCPVEVKQKTVPFVLLQLLYDCPLDTTRALLKRLKISSAESAVVVWCMQMRDLYLDPMQKRRAEVVRALAQPASIIAEEFYESCVGVSTEAIRVWRDVHAGPLCGQRKLPARWLNGEDLMQLGFAKGPRLGQVLEEVFNLQLEGKLADRTAALAWASTQKS